ncbi:hypothetical protein, partial [Enterobacter hormaechei]|uniref:hypothetical protein n=1 Tax=Enterobacter hormaechei TaxID=158836 RepID=UPI001953B4B2
LLFALYGMPQGLAGVFSGLSRRLFGRRPSEEPAMAPADAAGATLPGRATAGDRSDAPLLVAAGLSKSYGGVKPARDVSAVLTPGHI